jgi:hypothetical protein
VKPQSGNLGLVSLVKVSLGGGGGGGRGRGAPAPAEPSPSASPRPLAELPRAPPTAVPQFSLSEVWAPADLPFYRWRIHMSKFVGN